MPGFCADNAARSSAGVRTALPSTSVMMSGPPLSGSLSSPYDGPPAFTSVTRGPSRRRLSDEIPALAAHYLQKYAQECGKGDLRLAEEAGGQLRDELLLLRHPAHERELAGGLSVDGHVATLRADVGADGGRVDDAGEVHHVHVAVDADLLLAGDDQIQKLPITGGGLGDVLSF